MTNVNVPLLRKAVEWAEAEAAKEDGGAWYQGTWRFDVNTYLSQASSRAGALFLANAGVSPSCGTAFCIAGYVAQLEEPRFAKSDMVQIDGHPTHLAEFAQEALGLTDDDCDRLFDGTNTIADVREIAERIAGCPL